MADRSVVLIDADQSQSLQLAADLGRHGLQVEVYADASEVMGRKDDLPDLIVLCIDPKRTGWAVCNRLRKSASLKQIPLIITSAEATEKDFEDHKKLKARAEDYLHKPFGPEALVEKIAAQVGLPEPAVTGEMEIPLEGEDLSLEDAVFDDASMLDDPFEAQVEEDDPFSTQVGEDAAVQARGTEEILEEDEPDLEDRTRIGSSIDSSMDLEADAAFAAIGMDELDGEEPLTSIVDPVHSEEADLLAADPLAEDRLADSPPAEDPLAEEVAALADPEASDQLQPSLPVEEGPPIPAPLPEVHSSPASISEELDLGVEDVVRQVEAEPRRAEVAAASSSGGRAHDTSQHDTSGELLAELKRDKERLEREVEELRSRPAPKAESTGAGFSREREFLNLREVINKKEKEVLDLKDELDSKERQILDGKEKLREFERRLRDSEDRALSTERELVAAREKVEALTEDKERVVERERGVKARLDDAQKAITGLEEEIESWKTRHAADVSALEQSYNQAVATHQAEVQDLGTRHALAVDGLAEQHAAQLQEASAQAAQERATLEAAHARAFEELREAHGADKESLRARHEAQLAEAQQLQEESARATAEEHAAAIAALEAQHAGVLAEAGQQHADELAGAEARARQERQELEQRHAEAVAQAAERHRGELGAADDRRVQELAAREQEQRGQIEQLLAEHAAAKEGLERSHEAAVQALDARRQQELSEQGEQHALALAQREETLVAEHAAELEQRQAQHAEKLQALRQNHTDLKAGMQQRHATEVEELRTQHAEAITQLEEELRQVKEELGAGRARIGELEAALVAEQEQTQSQGRTLGELEARLQEAVADLVERDTRLGEGAQRIAELEQESAGYQDQILKAYQRIKSDESVVGRARKALAIALTLLEESAPEGGDQAAS